MGFLLRRFLLLQGLFLALLSAARLLFYFSYGDPAARAAERADWGEAALLGARFDLLVLAWLAMPLLLLLLFAAARGRRGGPGRWLEFSRHWSFWGFLLLAFVSMVDFGFYAQFQDRLNVMVFGFFEDHTVAVLGMIWDLYPIPLIVLCAVGFVWALRRMTLRILDPAAAPAEWGAGAGMRFGAAFLMLFAGFAAARGSLGKFPLRARMASVSTSSFVNLTILNGPFSLKEALSARAEEAGGEPLAQRLGFPQPAAAFRAWRGLEIGASAGADLGAGAGLDEAWQALAQQTPQPLNPEGPRPHVMLVLMESLGYRLFPFQGPKFDLLGSFGTRLPEGVMFTRGLPEANGTIGTVTAVATGLPRRPNTAYFSQSRLAGTAFRSAPAAFFQRAGYRTVFVYGGHTSWRKIDRFLPHQGFDEVAGLPAIHEALNLTDEDQAFWKTHDENTFAYLRKLLAEAEQPLFIVALTATNHPPFEWLDRFDLPPLEPPPELTAVLAEGALEGRLRGTQYSCRQLGGFLDRLAEDGLLERTIVAVTGDHNTADYSHYHEGEELDRVAVPIWLRVPEAWRPAEPLDPTAPAGHLDLLATLMHLALPSRDWAAIGSSLYDNSAQHRAAYEDGLTIDAGVAIEDGPRGARAWRWDPANPRLLERVKEEPEHAALRLWARARLAAADYLIRWHEPERP